MFTRNLILSFLLTVQVGIVFSLAEGRDLSSEESNSTQTRIWVEYLLGENGHKLLFHEDSPIQYAANFDYLPLVSSISTILNFVSSEKSPGYVLATYDYAQFLSRLSPIGHIADHYTSGPIKTAIILVSSILSGYAIFIAIAYGVEYIRRQLEDQETAPVTEGRSGGRSLRHQQHKKAEEVLTAGDRLQIADNQQVISWLTDLVRQSRLHYDDSSY